MQNSRRVHFGSEHGPNRLFEEKMIFHSSFKLSSENCSLSSVTTGSLSSFLKKTSSLDVQCFLRIREGFVLTTSDVSLD